MSEVKAWQIVRMEIPEGCNIILGQSHFIKTVEDLFEALVTSSPGLQFGIAFCEASEPCLVRRDGNAADLEEVAVRNALALSAGHAFIVLLRNGYPINVLDRIRGVQEVCGIFAATANPLEVLVFETALGRGIAGVVDGFPSRGGEDESHVAARKHLLRDIIGYKR